MIQFYSPDIETLLALPPEESAHCCRVLRRKAGDKIRVTDGKGAVFECEIVEADPKKTKFAVIKKEQTYEDFSDITLAIALTKNIDRISWLIEKAVEIGIGKIVLLDCTRNERRVANTERLRKNAVSAMNQSLKSRLPEITEVIRLKDFLNQEIHKDDLKVFGYCDDDERKVNFTEILKSDKGDGRVTVIVGPEGDFSPEEVETLKREGWLPVTFGTQRLRTETAGLYAVTAIHVIKEK